MNNPIQIITVVCTGNVCRSPMAERLLKHALNGEDEPLNSIEVLSAGVSAFAGDPASDNSVRALAKVGIDLNDHRSRKISPQLMEKSDLILAMTEGHLSIMQQLYPEFSGRMKLFGSFHQPQSPEVPDPFGGSLSLYSETRDNLAEFIPAIIQYLKDNNNET